MESIGIIIDYCTDLAEFLGENLRAVFDGFIQINTYFLSLLEEGDQVNDNVVLVMTKERAVQAEKYIANSQNIIVIHRTIKEKDAYPILAIPEGTKALVVNDTKETTLETVSLLYQIGINHLSLIPYEEGINCDTIKIAITPALISHVPRNIRKIMDIGNRYIDISTFIQIMNKLKMDNTIIRKRLIKYSDSIITLDSGIKNHYKDLFVKHEELDTVINLSNEGILLVNKDGVILLSNTALKKIFNINRDIDGKMIQDVFDKRIMRTFKNEEVHDELIEQKNKFIIINKRKIDYIGENVGYYFNFQEVTYIKQLEQNLTKKLRNKGFIARYRFDLIKTESPAMRECITLAKKIAPSDLAVFISGESGTGKELMAQSIHNYSKRSKQPFVAVNCAAVSESLLESELFGYEAGSFTGALKDGKTGLFELASNGTILLDEIGDMPLSLQTRLLRVLQEQQVMRIGSQSVVNVNVRVLAATNKNLFEMVQKGAFREDLYYRINVLPINIPPLRKRQEDIIPLLRHFMESIDSMEITEEAKMLLLSYNWPGNIRELQNVASYIELMNEETLTLSSLPNYLVQQDRNFEKELMAIEENFGIEKGMQTLKLIDQYNGLNLCIGRKNIEKTLCDRNILTSESEIRRILNSLNNLGIITSTIGRKGSQVTSFGKEFIKWAENRRDQ